jgi:hypothetical protein
MAGAFPAGSIARTDENRCGGDFIVIRKGQEHSCTEKIRRDSTMQLHKCQNGRRGEKCPGTNKKPGTINSTVINNVACDCGYPSDELMQWQLNGPGAKRFQRLLENYPRTQTAVSGGTQLTLLGIPPGSQPASPAALLNHRITRFRPCLKTADQVDRVFISQIVHCFCRQRPPEIDPAINDYAGVLVGNNRGHLKLQHAP